VIIHLCGPPGSVAGRAALSLLDLAPNGVYLAEQVTLFAGALLPHRFTFACFRNRIIGGLFSVALSFELPRLAVNQHPVLWSPDLPQHSKLCCGHLVDSPSLTVCLDLLIICNEYSLVFLVPSFLDETTKHLWLEFLKESDSIKFINQQNLEILCRSEKS